MDPITHGLVGGLAAKSVGASPRRFWIMTALGVFPDVDVLFNGLGGWAFWLQHRGISHSILGLCIQACLFSWLLKLHDPGPFWHRTWHYSLPLFLHSFFDLLTSFGVPLLSPFSFYDYSIDVLGGLALLPTAIMALGLVRMSRKGMSGWKVSRPLWALWLLYFLMSTTGKAYAVRFIPLPQHVVTTLPSLSNPFQWKAITVDNQGSKYQIYQVDLIKGTASPWQKYDRPIPEGWVQKSLESHEVQRFLENARWPIVRIVSSEEGESVEWGQLLFSTKGIVRGKIRISFNKDGDITNEQKIFSFWDPPSNMD